MHKIKRIARIRPIELRIVEFELQVRRHESRLRGREVRPDDFCGREGVGELDGPDTGAGADVNDLLRAAANRCQEELAVQEDREHLMANVEGLVREFIIRSPVGAFVEVVVSTTI